jgi:hypothetical protein
VNNNDVPGKPDIPFYIKTYQKIAETSEDNTGDQILLPINLFFREQLDLMEQNTLYDMYRHAKNVITAMNKDNRRELQDDLQEKVYNTIKHLNLVPKLIAFCQTSHFIYPDLQNAGTEAHHTPAKTFLPQDYVEITASSLLSKMMVPIWGEFIYKLRALEVDQNKIEKIAFDLIEPSLEEGAFERIYQKLYFSLSTLVREKRLSSDKKAMMSGVVSSYILTHNGIDDEMFNAIVMSTIIVKRMATYECFMRHKGSNQLPPNAMVYIDDGIKRTTETRIQGMRSPMKTMPRKELPQHDTEDNSSILDHASKTSNKPIDVPIFVATAVQEWELPKLLEITDTPLDVYRSAAAYYRGNSFDISPLCQAMVASFIGTRFGGSKCLGYLSPTQYQELVVILQIFLIRNNFRDLAALVTSRTSPTPVDGAHGSMPARIDVKLKTTDYYSQCLQLFKGWIAKPVPTPGKRGNRGKPEMEKLDFITHIHKMKDWLVHYTHAENMAPALWEFSGDGNYPITGSEVQFDENVIANLCRFYLLCHGNQRPF